MPKQTALKYFIMLLACCQVMNLLAVNAPHFISNEGQWNKDCISKISAKEGEVFFTKSGWRYSFWDEKKLFQLHHRNGDIDGKNLIKYHSVFMELLNSNPNSIPIKSNLLEYPNYHYYMGSNGWEAIGFEKQTLKNIYQDIDLQITAMEGSFEYDFYIKNPEDYKNIQFEIKGAKSIKIDKAGQLIITTSLGQIVEQKPIAWQEIPINEAGNKNQNSKFILPVEFKLEKNIVSFNIKGEFFRNYPLVIDPKVIFATFSGSKADNFGFTATYDSLGLGYSGGTVYDFGFPTTSGAIQRTFQGGTSDNPSIGDVARDCGILKYSADGKNLLYCTYLGGKGNEQPHSMVVNHENDLVIFGSTTSYDFPHTKNGYDTTKSDSSDCFLSLLSKKDGSLKYSTYIGSTGIDGWNGFIPRGKIKNISPLGYNYADIYRGEVICDKSGNVYVATSTTSTNFPMSDSSAQKNLGGIQDALVFKMSPKLDSLKWSSYIGGISWETANGIEIDSKRNLFVTGASTSPYFFNDSITYQKLNNGASDGFICSFDNDGRKILNASFLGTIKYDQSFFVQIDAKDDIYLYGQTAGGSTFPIKNVNFKNNNSGQFISKFNNELDTLEFSTLFGSGRNEVDIAPSAFLVDNCGKIYVSGWGGYVNAKFEGGNGGFTYGLPITKDAIQSKTDSSDFYIAVFAKGMDTLLFGSFFGGTSGSWEHVDGGTSRFDKRGVIYQSVCGGCGGYSDFPTTPNAWSRLNLGKRPNNPSEGGCNNLLFKVDLDIPDIKADFEAPNAGCYPFKIKTKNLSIRGKSFLWDFGDGTSSSTLYEPSHTYALPGTYNLRLVVKNLYSCSINDTAVKSILAYSKADAKFSIKLDSCSSTAILDARNSKAETYKWTFSTGKTIFGSKTLTYTFPKTGKFNVQLFVDDSTKCVDTSTANVNIIRSDFTFQVDTCTKTIKINKVTARVQDYIWSFDGDTIFGVDTPSYTFQKAGNHTVVLHLGNDQNGFCDTVSKLINIPERIKTKILFQIDTCNKELVILDYNPKSGNPEWYFNKKYYPITQRKFKLDTFGSYSLSIVGFKGSDCQDTSTIRFKIKALTKADFSIKADLCKPEVKIIPINSLNSLMVWDYGDGSSDSINTTHTHKYKEDISYTITLILNSGKLCADTIKKSIKLNPPSKAKFKVIENPCNSTVQFINLSENGKTFKYDFGDGEVSFDSTVKHTFPKRGAYRSRLFINIGTDCTDTFRLTTHPGGFTADSISLTNFITPNGDGKNDAWTINGALAECVEWKVWVFNRWGQELYFRKSNIHSWPGTNKSGEVQAAGTYFFIIQSEEANVKREGTIDIVK